MKNIAHHTSIDLSEKARNDLITTLNGTLATLNDLYLALKQAHWNVKGATFIGLHELFDAIAEEVEEQIDVVAERITALGGTAFGTTQAIASTTTLRPYPTDIFSAEEHLRNLIERIAYTGEEARTAIAKTGELDLSTADVYTDLSRLLDKRLWFLQAHTQK